MSLNLIISTGKEFFVAGDRRGTKFNNGRGDEGNLLYQSIKFYDDNQKTHFLNPPHNFIVFAFAGDSNVDSSEIINQFSITLPDGRLNILEYVNLFNQFIKNNIDNFGDPGIPFRCTWFLSGVDSNGKPQTYFLRYPGNHEPALIAGPTDIGFFPSDSGTKYGEKLLGIYLNKSIQKLENKIQGQHLLGLPISRKNLAKLKIYRAKGVPFALMETGEILEFIEFVFNYIIDEKELANEIPIIGGGIDILRVGSYGIKEISYKPDTYRFERPLAQVNFHHILFTCCPGVEIKFNLPLVPELAKRNDFVDLPANGIMECQSCGSAFSVEDL